METKPSNDIFSFHLLRIPLLKVPWFIFSSIYKKNVPGLIHSEKLLTMNFGEPVERQVRDHKGQSLALAAIRPLGTFSTFSIWKNEAEMLNMVHGKRKNEDQQDHKAAMQERARKDFHYEFTTMRFSPFKEVGTWNGKSNFTSDTTTRL